MLSAGARTDWGFFVSRFEKIVYRHMDEVAMSTDLEDLRGVFSSTEFERFRKLHTRSLNQQLRDLFGMLCCAGSIEAASLFMTAGGLKVTDTSTCLNNGSDDDEGISLGAPCAAQPLYHAAMGGSPEAINWLLELGADPAVPASDGTTPFYIACERGHTTVVHLLYNLGVDMTASDQDGTSPALIAAANGHTDVIKFLHKVAVDLRAPGHIYLDEQFALLRRNVTPLSVARELGQDEVAEYLETALGSNAEKRVRSDDPMLDRARKAGVADRLKPIPDTLLTATRPGSGAQEQIQAAKKQLKAFQTANQQIVARAEKARLKQAKLM